jgi:hypothetical protein
LLLLNAEVASYYLVSFGISLFVRLLNAALFGMYLPETGARFPSGGCEVTAL